MMAPVDRAAVASMIDHTLLAPEATQADIEALCHEAGELGVAAVCVHPRWVAVAHDTLHGTVPVASVVGFPSGAHRSDTKGREAALAVDDGASEIDMVVALGSVVADDWDVVGADIADVRAKVPAFVTLKVIVESAALDASHLARVCEVAVDHGADYVKTSTGFHPTGGATIEAVTLMRETVGPSIGVKASGGIRDAATALAMIDAGATRIGASATRAILDGMASGSDRLE